MMSLMLPQADGSADQKKKELSQRIRQAMLPGQGARPREDSGEKEIEIDATLTFSAQELLQQKDFAEMTAEELDAAKAALAHIAWPFRPQKTRRLRPDPRGPRTALRATLQARMRTRRILIQPKPPRN